MNKNTNAANTKRVITIRVESTDLDRWTCTYRNYHEVGGGKAWTFRASIGVDRAMVEALEPGKGYQIVQVVDEFNTTHWTHAVEYNGVRRLGMEEIMLAVARKKAKRVINEDLLLW